MEIRDPIHGSIPIHSDEIPILESSFFQRLRNIKQLGFGEMSFPSATHNRFIHSLGAMHTATLAFNSALKNGSREYGPLLQPQEIKRFRSVIRLAALLHDIGHGPVSHASEAGMPAVSQLKIPLSNFSGKRQATHEDYTLKILLDSPLTPVLERFGQKRGLKPIHLAALFDPGIPVNDGFFEIGGINFRPFLKQLISSELDSDRMDYLRRDSFCAGVSYGQFDFSWLIGSLGFYLSEKQVYLSLEHRALYAFEDFLTSRFHMFLMVYFHHKTVIFDAMLQKFFETSEALIPSDIEKYREFDDVALSSLLIKSKESWAKRITKKQPFQLLVEIHEGILGSKAEQAKEKADFIQIQNQLTRYHLDYLSVTSVSEFSKYFGKSQDPLFIRYDDLFHPPRYIPMEACTPLFKRYSDKRVISRIYIPSEVKKVLKTQ